MPRNFLGLSLNVAYPGLLGPKIPEPPAGFTPYDDGYQAMNDEGDYMNWDAVSQQWVLVQNITPPQAKN